MTVLVLTYLLYLLVSTTLTIWVGHTLSRNGRIFLVDVMGGDEKLADSVNHLLVVGFYLVNLGFVSWYLRTADQVVDLRGLLETLSVKVGSVLLVLGVVHLGNVWVFGQLRRRIQRERVAAAPGGVVIPPR
jgi:hypothetical protein